jgi:hypothetical protein
MSVLKLITWALITVLAPLAWADDRECSISSLETRILERLEHSALPAAEHDRIMDWFVLQAADSPLWRNPVHRTILSDILLSEIDEVASVGRATTETITDALVPGSRHATGALDLRITRYEVETAPSSPRFGEIAADTRTTVGTTEITPGNIDDVFSYNATTGGGHWTKAVSYVNDAGEVDVVFIRQGEASVDANVHHRDVLASILRGRVTLVVREGRPASEVAAVLEQAMEVSSTRSIHSSVPDSTFARSQGYQFTSRTVGGRHVITEFSIDSGITSTIAGRRLTIDPEVLANQLQRVIERIDPSIRTFRHIGYRNLSRLSSTNRAAVQRAAEILRSRGITYPIVDLI